MEAYESTLSKIAQLETERLTSHASQDGFARRSSQGLGELPITNPSSTYARHKPSMNGVFHEEGGLSAGRTSKDGHNSFVGAVGGAAEGKTYKSTVLDQVETSYLDASRLRTFPELKASNITQDGAGMVNQKEMGQSKGRGISNSGYDTWSAARGSLSGAETGVTLGTDNGPCRRISGAGTCRPKTSLTQDGAGLTHSGGESAAIGSRKRKSESGRVNVGSLEQTGYGMSNSVQDKIKNPGSHVGKLTYSQIMENAPSSGPSSPTKAHAGKTSAGVLGAEGGSLQPVSSPTRTRTMAYAGRATASKPSLIS